MTALALPARLPLAWRAPLAALAATWAALLALFARDVGDLASIYWNSTTFGHCLFVLPVVGWLVATRRRDLARLAPAAWWPGLALVGAGAAAWFLGQVAGVGFARHLGLVLMLQGAAVATLGPAVARACAFPLAYLLFLVPFGEWLEAPLQAVTVAMAMPMLHAVGVPASVDGVLITTSTGWFEVAEACSGAKFVIAMVAYAALVANVGFVSARRRAVFFAGAMVVPVIANGIRAFATIYAAHLTSVAAATGFDHIVYGWVFFAAVMVAVLALAWRWFDRDPDAPAFDVARIAATRFRSADRWSVAGAALGLAALAWASGTAVASRADVLPNALVLPEVAGWRRVPLATGAAAWEPHYPGADHMLVGRYADAAGRVVDMSAAVYAGQREGRELVGFGQGVLRENDRWVRVADDAPLSGGGVTRIVAGPVARTVATWYRIGDETTASARVVKIETAKTKLLGGRQRATALHLSGVGPGARDAMTRFLAAAGTPTAIADTIAEGR